MAVVRELIARHGVAVVPGSAFGVEEGCSLRLSYAAVDRATMETGGEAARGRAPGRHRQEEREVSVQIPFRRELEFEYGRVDLISPPGAVPVRRVVARNPSAFTLYGTGTYIVGRGRVAVIDPGPALPDHVEALAAAVAGEEVSHVLVTHTHNDHSPATRPFKARVGAGAVYGYGPHGSGRGGGAQVEEGGDMEFVPEVEVRDGDVIEGDGWSFECVHTPGHTSNHVCFALREDRLLFSGDHVMGWSTSVISPPDGDMGDYLRSLARLLERGDVRYWPTHGPCIDDPKPYVRAFIAHRREREEQILACLRDGVGRIADMAPRMYAGLAPGLLPAARRSVFAAVLGLVESGRVATDGEPAADSVYRLAEPGPRLAG